MSQTGTTTEPQHDNVRPLCPAWLSTIATIILAAIILPLFVCAPVTSDTSLFDVQAMTVLKGGVLYRDMVEPNLPGIVWIHIAIRTLTGWSSEAIRIIDVCIFGAILVLLSSLIGETTKPTQRIGAVAMFILACSLFYLTRNEWCHCQRDIWMLLPVSCAMWLRTTRSDDAQPRPYSSLVEGIFWGIAFWIKPHVAIPAVSVIAIDLIRMQNWIQRSRDVTAVIAGGLIAAAPGIVWLISTGAWQHFWEMMLDWNPEYLEAGRTRRSWERVGQLLQRFHPWWAVHLVAVPVAMSSIVASIRNRSKTQSNEPAVRGIFSACYVSWLVQTCLLQHAMDYIHVPELILALAVIAMYPWQLDLQLRRVTVAAILGLALLATPQFYNGRLAVWQRCFSEGSTPELRSILAQGNYPDWNHLHNVEQFLIAQEVNDGEVACLNVHSIHLHQELAVLPATRYLSINCLLTMFPQRYDQIMDTVYSGRHRFIVVEINETNQKNQVLPETFPNEYPVVFASGSYRVHDAMPKSNISTVQK